MRVSTGHFLAVLLLDGPEQPARVLLPRWRTVLPWPYIASPSNELKQDELRFGCRFEIANCRTAIDGYSSSARRRPRSLGRTLLRRAFSAKSAENEFAIANDALAQGARGRPGHVVPLNVVNISAAVADEVMMQKTFGIESSGAALDRNFTHQACLHQVTQIVISGGPRRAGIGAIHGFEDLDGGGVPVLFHQEGHHGVALRSAAQPAAFQ
jgi:hypothetical protein